MTPSVALEQDRHTSAYEDHRSYVLAVLARRCRWLEPDEREVVLHDAWMIVLEKESAGTLDFAGMRAHQVRAYLVQTAVNRALAEGRRASRTRNEPLGDRDDFAAATAAPEDVVDAAMDGARVREIVAELTARQQTIVKLRFFFDRTPDEIQRLLNITERAYRRDLERAMKVVSEGYELVREGRFCDRRLSLIRAYVAGIAGPNRAREAREHLASCPACRRFALELREATDRFAGVLPLPVLAGWGASGRGPLAHVADLLGGGRDAVAHAGGSAKQQLTSLTLRVDPTAPTVAAVRPGAVAAAIAGCLAVSSGAATYCAVVGVPAPLAGAIGVTHHAKDKPKERAAAPKRKAAAMTRTVAATPAAATTPSSSGAAKTTATKKSSSSSSSASSTKTTKKRATAKQKAQAKTSASAASELGLEGAGQAVGSGTPTASTASAGSSASGSGGGAGSGAVSTAPKVSSNAPPGEFDP